MSFICIFHTIPTFSYLGLYNQMLKKHSVYMTFTVGRGDCVCLLFCRQCALVALQDVKAYLTGEGGQIAVSHLSIFMGIWLMSRYKKCGAETHLTLRQSCS